MSRLRMNTRSFVATSALMLAALACRDSNQSLTEPTAPQAVVAATTALTFWQVSAGATHACGVTTDNLAYCWGANQHGALGIGTDTGPEICRPFNIPCSTRPVAVAGGLRFRNVSAGAMHTCGVTTANRAYCWGWGTEGQVGDGTNAGSNTPVAVAGGLTFRSVSAGDQHTCGVTTDNRAYCWGLDQGYGLLGDPGIVPYFPITSPHLVVGGLPFREVSVGEFHSCGVTTANRAYCWGGNFDGQLGDSTSRARHSPVPVAGGLYFRQLDAGATYTCAVTMSYRAWCWGDGREGQLGNGHLYLSYWPRRAAGDLRFDRVTGGGGHSCAETTTNRAYCWGGNGGALGDGTTTLRLTPVAVAGGLYFRQLSTGNLFTCGKTPAGVAYCWGANDVGQLGDGTTTTRLKPTPVAGPM